jgi:hypothetical protein
MVEVVVEVVVLVAEVQVVILVYLSVAPPRALLLVGMLSKLFSGAVTAVEACKLMHCSLCCS